MEQQKLGPKQQEWVNALRSEKFKQGQGFLHLHYNDSYCCLGVACKTFGEEISGEEIDLSLFTNLLGDIQLIDHIGSIHGAYQICIKNYIEERFNILCPLSKNVGSLVDLNDVVKLNFNQIADVIESFPDAFFYKEA